MKVWDELTNTEIEIVESSLTDLDEETFSQGGCWQLALELEKDGFEFAVIQQFVYEEFDYPHAFAIDGDKAVDVFGRVPLSKMSEKWSKLLGQDVKVLRGSEAHQAVGSIRSFPAISEQARKLIDANKRHFFGKAVEAAAPKEGDRFHWKKEVMDHFDGFEILVTDIDTGESVGNIAVNSVSNEDNAIEFEVYENEPFYDKINEHATVIDIKHLQVETKYQGQGVAKYLYNLAIKEIKRKYAGVPVFINASPMGGEDGGLGFDDLVRFYQRAGLEVLKKYPEHRNAALWIDDSSKLKLVASFLGPDLRDDEDTAEPTISSHGDYDETATPVEAMSKTSLDQMAKEHLSNVFGKPELPLPEWKLANNLNSRWLGQCSYSTKMVVPTIALQKSILSDEKTLDRVLLHELIHYVLYLTDEVYIALFKSRGEEFRRIKRQMGNNYGHGPAFQKWAGVINSKFGADYVSEKSDTSYVQEASKDFYVVIAPSTSKPGQLRYGYYQNPNTLTMKSVDRLKETGGKVFKTKDKDFAAPKPLGRGNLYLAVDEDLQKKIRELYESGQPIAASIDLRQARIGTEPRIDFRRARIAASGGVQVFDFMSLPTGVVVPLEHASEVNWDEDEDGEWQEEEFNYRLNTCDEIYYAVQGGEIVGHLGISDDTVRAVYVDHGARGEGVASAMYEKVFDDMGYLRSDDFMAMEPGAKAVWKKLVTKHPGKVTFNKQGRYFEYDSEGELEDAEDGN